VAEQRGNLAKLGLVLLPFVAPIPVIWVVLEQVSFYKADSGLLQSSGWWGLAGTLGLSILIGTIILFLRRGPTPVTVAEFSTNLAYLPLYVADELRYFAREGLEVTFKQTFGDSATWRSVVEKNAEFGVADPIAMLEDDGDDAGIVVAAVVIRSPTRAVTNRAMAPVTNARQLKGISLRVYGRDTTSYKLLANFLRDGGIDPEAADIQVMKPNTEASQLLDPSNPLVFTFDPAAAAALQNGAREVFNGSIAYGEFLNTGVFVCRRYADQNPMVVQRFVNALEAALCFMYANRGFTVDFAAQKFKDASRNSIMVGVARLFSEGVYPRHATVDAHLWSRAVAKRFGHSDLSKFQFGNHADRTFADRAVTLVQHRRDWTGLRAKVAHALKPRR
jgi:ABC-type nitrate/sulfonate/bicarbonate transport system substrate-binding protein